MKYSFLQVRYYISRFTGKFWIKFDICQGFKYGGDPWSGWFRLSFPLRGDYLDVALERFERLLDARSEHDYCRI
jgi:hypothetical protein